MASVQLFGNGLVWSIACLLVATTATSLAAPGGTTEPTHAGADPRSQSIDRLMIASMAGEQVHFVLPAGAAEYTVLVDWSTGTVQVEPGKQLFLDGNGNTAGCFSVSVIVASLVPWARSPVGGPVPCGYQDHAWPFDRTAVQCAVSVVCHTDGLALLPPDGYFVIVCSVGADGDDGHPDWAPTTGTCQYSQEGAPPTAWTRWDSICGAGIPAGIARCLHSAG